MVDSRRRDRGLPRRRAYLVEMTHGLAGTAGLWAGRALAPLTALGSAVRHARLFHPAGIVVRGMAQPVPEPYQLRAAGMQLAGPILIRFSGGFWKTHPWPDVLGCAIRFTADDVPSATAGAGDQDLLLATIRHPLTTLLSPLSTHFDDYLGNDYFGVSPFEVPELGRVKLRLSPTPARVCPDGSSRRDDRLRAALSESSICLRLQARAERSGASYHTIALIELGSEVAIDQEALHFDPFRTGRGLRPVGFVHGLRIASYRASRWARALTAPASTAPPPPPAASRSTRQRG
jgi:hypothetical protein